MAMPLFFYQLLRDSRLHALVKEVESWHTGCLLVVKLKEALQSLL